MRPRVLWISPTGRDFGGTPVDALRRRLEASADVELLGLCVWGHGAGDPYGMDVEVGAVAAAAGAGPCHLAGFSAAATVVLAAALALGERVRSAAVIEPASIGDDDWAPAEAEWRRAMTALWELPAEGRTAALRGLLVAADVEPPPSRNPPRWDFRDALLERMLMHEAGFLSADLGAIRAPVLAIRGGRSHPRFAAVGRRLAEACPNVRELVFPDLHHFAPPFREEPEALAAALLGLWTSA